MSSSGLYKVDALLQGGDALHAAGTNIIAYSFSVPSVSGVNGEQALNDSQKSIVRSVLSYIAQVTGIVFQEGSGIIASKALHFCTGDVVGVQAVCDPNGSQSFDIAIDTVTYPEFANFGSSWVQGLLLHEIGHALGIGHPSGLPASENNSAYTVMSYDWDPGAPTTYKPYDLLALSWIYGGDGIGGTWGYGSTNGPVLPPEAYPPITHDISGGGSANEGGSYTFTVTRAGNISVATTVAWAVAGGADAADFGGTLPSGVVSFAAGETSKAITISATDDQAIEADETFTVSLGARTGNGAVLGSSTSVSFTIQDNDTPPSVSISPEVRVTEGNAGSTLATFTISRAGNLGRSDTINWTFSHGSTSDADFASKPPAFGSVNFTAGQASATVSVSIAGDTQVEANETFFIDLSSVGWGTVANSRGVGYIVGDDVNNTVTIAAKAASVEEGNTGERVVEFTISRSGVTSADAAVYWSLGGTVNNEDLGNGSATGGMVTLAAGQTQGTVSLPIKGDTRIENDELMTVRLVDVQGLGAGLGGAVEATTTIVNDDPKGEVSVRVSSATSVVEGNTGATTVHTFVLTRGGDLSQPATIPWQIGGTVNAADFGSASLPSGAASFAAGASTATVSVTMPGDTLFEENETLSLVLSNGDLLVPSATQGTASVVITNDDEANEVRIRAVNPSRTEGSVPGISSGFQFEVTRNGDLTGSATIEIEVVGVGEYPANADDFMGAKFPTIRIQLAGGEKSRTFFVDVAQDTQREADEGFAAIIKSATGATVSTTQGSASAVIVSDEPLPGLSVSAAASSVAEGNSGLKAVTFTVSRDQFVNEQATVQWKLGGTVGQSDLQAGQSLQGQVTFDAYESQKTVTVQLQGDEDFEPNEVLTLTLQTPTNAVIAAGKGSASVTVTNDDNQVRVVQGSAAANEKVVLSGARADYALTFEPATGTLRVADQVLDRDGDLRIKAVEALQFTDAMAKALPSSTELKIMQLAQAVLGSSGVTPALWASCLDIVKAQGIQGLATYAAEALFTGMSAADMAQVVLVNLNCSASTLQGANRQADYAWTVNYLTELFSGNAAARGASLLAVGEVLGTLEADAVYGRVATTYNDNIGLEWINDLSADQVTLIGLPNPLEPVPLG